MGQNAGRRAPTFQFFSTAGRRAPSLPVATYLASWNNAEFQPKMPPPDISTQWELLPRWLRERSSSLSHKCSVQVLFKSHHKYLGRCDLKSNCARIQYCTLADRFPFRTVRLECVIDAISLILHIPSFLRRLSLRSTVRFSFNYLFFTRRR